MTNLNKTQLKIVDKSLFEHPVDGAVIAHGVNCMGAMGAGIAVQFKKRWPRMYEEYRSRCKEGNLILGQSWSWEEVHHSVASNLTLAEKRVMKIYNLAIKSHWRNPASYLAIESSVNEMLDDMAENGDLVVAMPWIGCGLGGLDKAHVKKILKRCLNKDRKNGNKQEIWVYAGKSK